MGLEYYLLEGKSIFILLGIVAIIVGKYFPVNFIMPKRTKYKVIDEENYVKSFRITLYYIGFYYILFGTILIFINGWPTGIGIFVMIPLLIIIVSLFNMKKYMKK